MPKTIISEGKTSTEAIEKGLKELHVSRDRVEIKILEEEKKKSFFSILAPRVVKVELTLKEGVPESKGQSKKPQYHKENNKVVKQEHHEEKKEPLKQEDVTKANQNLSEFLDNFITKIPETTYKITSDEEYIYVTLTGKEAGILIGYRGETLNALQTILSAIASKNVAGKVRIILDIEGYREKRKIALENLADNLARKVINTGKQVNLEPMSAYERKIIHNRLQDSQRVRTYSVGEDPYRKVVIERK